MFSRAELAVGLACGLYAALAAVWILWPGPRAAAAPSMKPPEWEAQPDHLNIAGSGSNIEITRAIARAFERHNPGAVVHVHASIGSGGGVLAVADGAVDLGMISRALGRSEGDGLVVTPLARVPVCLVTHERAARRTLTREALGPRVRDAASTAFLVREPGDSGERALEQAYPGLSDALAYARTHGARVLRTDLEMRDALLSTADSMGVFDLGTIKLLDLPLTPVAVDGETCPAAKPLSFVSRGVTTELVSRFLEFSTSDAVRGLLQSARYEPAP